MWLYPHHVAVPAERSANALTSTALLRWCNRTTSVGWERGRAIVLLLLLLLGAVAGLAAQLGWSTILCGPTRTLLHTPNGWHCTRMGRTAESSGWQHELRVCAAPHDSPQEAHT